MTSKASSISAVSRWRESGGPDRLRFAEKDERAIDEVRAEIPEDAGGRKIRLFTPCTGLALEAEAVEAGFVFGDCAEGAGLQPASSR